MIKRAAHKITAQGCRLSIVRNPDGLLAMDDVRRALSKEAGLTIVTGSRLALRAHFETIFKEQANERFVYICDNIATLVPDMTAGAFVTEFSVGDLFPLFANKSLLSGLDLPTLTLIYNRLGYRRAGMVESQRIVDEARQEIERQRRQSAEHFINRFASIGDNWDSASDIITEASSCLVDAIRCGVQDALAPSVDTLNGTFQRWIDREYFATLNSNHLLHPKAVNKILPYIADKHNAADKVALIVIDGLAYWQYSVLSSQLRAIGIEPTEGHTLAWIPTITMLSRQAIFRGAAPHGDYKQSPANEQRLWRDYWRNRGLQDFALQYIADKDEFAINEGVTRLAYVTVEMDEKMHSSSDYRDLLSLTENWAPRIAEKIAALRGMGYTIYLTTDHGSAAAQGWQPISQIDKVFLYKDGSRGKRHLIYNNLEQKNAFLSKHRSEIEMLSHDNWLAVRSDACFDRSGQQSITHGGSHFWEVVIPFIEI